VLDKYPSSKREEVTTVPKFIDTHPMKPFTADALNKLQNAPPDEFGVMHHDSCSARRKTRSIACWTPRTSKRSKSIMRRPASSVTLSTK
jgi:hypothetical protein